MKKITKGKWIDSKWGNSQTLAYAVEKMFDRGVIFEVKFNGKEAVVSEFVIKKSKCQKN